MPLRQLCRESVWRIFPKAALKQQYPVFKNMYKIKEFILVIQCAP